MSEHPADPPIRDAATIIVYRSVGPIPEILMGQRGSKAAFMPDKFVFPGGAVGPEDHGVGFSARPSPTCMARLSEKNSSARPEALIAAAIRELWEETGLVLGSPGSWNAPHEAWNGFAATGHAPNAEAIRFIFRAVTPPGRPRRFDARFFLVPGSRLRGELGGDGELSNLQWIQLDKVRRFNLPFITQVVLAELPALIARDDPPERVPFFNGRAEETLFESLARPSLPGPAQ